MEATRIKRYERRPYTFDRVVRLVLATLFAGAVVWLLSRLSSVLLPFLVAWLIAYLLEPFVQRNKRMFGFKGRIMPIALTLLSVLMTIVVLCVLFLPSIFQEMNQMAVLIKHYANANNTVAFIPQSVHDFLRDHIDFKKIGDEMTGQDMRSLLDMLANLLSSGFDILLGFINWCLAVLYVIFIMLDYERLLEGFKHMVPPRLRPSVFSVFNDVTASMNHYFRGQSLVAMCVGVLFAIGFTIVGLPLGLVLGLFIGVLNLVPYLQLISIIPTTLLCLVYAEQDGVGFWNVWWACMGVYIVVQCIQDLFLTPKIMGKYMGLNPAIILLSLSVWGSLLGFIGLIIALPLTTLLLSYYDRYIINRDDGETPGQKQKDEEAFAEAVTTYSDDEPE